MDVMGNNPWGWFRELFLIAFFLTFLFLLHFLRSFHFPIFRTPRGGSDGSRSSVTSVVIGSGSDGPRYRMELLLHLSYEHIEVLVPHFIGDPAITLLP